MDAREQFTRQSEGYRNSPVHATGRTLQRSLDLLGLSGAERVLDVDTGAGHLAFALATAAREVVALDLTPGMLAVAADEAARRGLGNIDFVEGDAARLPFPSDSFQNVVCRVAAHHFPAPGLAVVEMARVVEPGGSVLVIDTSVPEDEDLDRSINELETLRDPSHIRDWRPSEWQAFFRRAGLSVAYQEWGFLEREMPFTEWVERSGTPRDQVAKTRRLLLEADPALRMTLALRQAGEELFFQLPWVMTLGHRPPPGGSDFGPFGVRL